MENMLKGFTFQLQRHAETVVPQALVEKAWAKKNVDNRPSRVHNQ